MPFGSQLLTRSFCLPHQASSLSVKSYNLSFHFSLRTSQSSYINHLLVQQTNILLHADYSSTAAAVLLYFLPCWSNPQTAKAKWYFFSSSTLNTLKPWCPCITRRYRAILCKMSLYHQHNLLSKCHNNFRSRHCEKLLLLKGQHLMSYYRIWPDYFLTFHHRAEDCFAKLRDISINTVVISWHSLSFTNLAGC